MHLNIYDYYLWEGTEKRLEVSSLHGPRIDVSSDRSNNFRDYRRVSHTESSSSIAYYRLLHSIDQMNCACIRGVPSVCLNIFTYRTWSHAKCTLGETIRKQSYTSRRAERIVHLQPRVYLSL